MFSDIFKEESGKDILEKCAFRAWKLGIKH